MKAALRQRSKLRESKDMTLHECRSVHIITRIFAHFYCIESLRRIPSLDMDARVVCDEFVEFFKVGHRSANHSLLSSLEVIEPRRMYRVVSFDYQHPLVSALQQG